MQIQVNDPEQFGFSTRRLERINGVMQRYIDQEKLAGIVSLVARRGSVVHLEKFGVQDFASGKPVEFDTIFRFYSMSKPITSAALMMLYEEGRFQLDDPVSRFLPEFKETKVWAGEDELADLNRPITIRHLLTHTAGLSYGGFEETGVPVDKLYDEAGFFDEGVDTAEMVRRIAALPLAYQPGQVWHYSMATDVIGYLIQVIAGMPFDAFLQERILGPLGMVDTDFYVPAEKLDRLAEVYSPSSDGLEPTDTAIAGDFTKPQSVLLGGSGLVSTASDYMRFCQLMLNGGALDGVRLLGRKTVELMTANHLPDGLLPIGMGPDVMRGYGFGLGFRVLMDVAQSGMLGSVGVYRWGGWASTIFFIDPQEELIAMLLLQLIPSGHYPIAEQFEVLVYQALVR
ncbi:MAG: hypothetical protein B6I35_04715 [Anaerolineaceae bacterium 4572_32.2]|nr:MAG: hypothetical protein B6I35_04715 [Anaerolineaceae bacterium 4572_32.2]HEY72889.1 beta-lactamase family protein [Thermoflexia bacterium]